MSRIKRDPRSSGNAPMILALIAALVLFVLNIYASKAEAQVAKWAAQPSVNLDNSGAPYVSVHVESGIEEAIWAWSSRMPEMDLKYVGLTLGPVENAVITYKWLDPWAHMNLTGSMFTPGAEQKWIYLDSGLIARSVIYLNASYFKGGIDRCQLTTISHELGHALGLNGHSPDPEDLMYWAPAHCRYTPTDNDIRLTGHAASGCHAVLTRDNDISVPDIAGQQAYLKYIGNQEWKLEHFALKSSRSCTSAEFDSKTGMITLHDLRNTTKRYSARLEPIGDDKWKLATAESR